MLKKLEITNFRSHKNSILEFVPGINIIVGLSNSGKTNIFRAFDWLRTNRPKGIRFISNFSKEKDKAKVKATFINGEYVSVEKGRKGSAIYGIGNKDKELDRFEKVGFDVPDKIIEFLKIDDVNMQSQLDQYFLITSSAGEVAREINRITHLEEVDKWTKTFTTKINSLNKEIAVYTEQIKVKNQEISNFSDLKDFEKNVISVENISKSILDIDLDIEKLQGYFYDINEIYQEIDKLKEYYLSFESDILKANDLFDDIEDRNKKIYSLQDIISSIEDNDENFKGDSGIEEIVMQIDVIQEKIKDCDDEITIMQNIIKDIDFQDSVLNESDKFIDVETGKFRIELMKRRKCPFCSSNISKEDVDEIIMSI